jgi:hypothetical protein
MNLAQPRFSGPSSRGLLVLLGSIVVGAWAAYQCAQWVINDDMQGMAFAGLVIVGGAVVIGILNNWRNGVYLFLGWLLFEDLARKFLGNNMAIYFAKDFLLLVVYISFFADCRKRKVKLFKAPFIVPVVIFVWFGVMQIFNPASTSIWYGLMGFKIFFYYVPLIFVGYALFDSEAELRRFFMINLMLALVIVGLGLAQSIIGPSFLNPAHQADDLALLSGMYRVSPQTGQSAYRPTSVFVSNGRFCDFVNIAWLLTLGFSGFLLLRQKKGRMFAFICVAVTAAAAFLTASRGTFLWSLINGVVTSVAFIWGAPWRQREARRAFKGVQRAALAVAGAIVLLFMIFPDALLSRVAIYRETLDPNSRTSEIGNRTWDYPMTNFLAAFTYPRWVEGYGIGTTALGGQYVARFFKVVPPVVGVESGFGTLVVEMGIGGLILWIIMAATIALTSWRVVKKLKGSPLLPIAFAIFWYAFVLLFPSTYAGIQAYEDYLLSCYLWLMLGILFRLPTLKLASLSVPAAPAKPGWPSLAPRQRLVSRRAPGVA